MRRRLPPAGVRVLPSSTARRSAGFASSKAACHRRPCFTRLRCSTGPRRGPDFGLSIPSARPNPRALHARKLRIIGDFARYRARQLGEWKFRLYRSPGRFADPHTVILGDGRRLRARQCLIATGSRVSVPPVPGLREAGCWTRRRPRPRLRPSQRDHARRRARRLRAGPAPRAPGSARRTCAAKREYPEQYSPAAAAVLEKAFTTEGIEVRTGTRSFVASGRRGFTVIFRCDSRTVERRADYCCNALGREPCTEGLRLSRRRCSSARTGRS